jgi:RNA polymerase sigma-70 factor (ECF subfamily)
MRQPAKQAELSEGFGRVYAEHFALVFRGLRRLGVSEAALEDAVQDVFLVVHRKWSAFEGRCALRTWVYGIAVKVAKDYRRAEARHSRRVQRFAELSQCEPASVSPSDRLERREANRLLHTALGALHQEERAVFVLVELEELSMREAAQAMRLNLRTCQRRLKSARQAFEASIEQLSANRRSSS